jgi:hypothetical protein
MRRVSLLALAVAFVGMSFVADKSAMFVGVNFQPDNPSSFTGTIAEWRPGESIWLSGDQNRAGFELRLRHDTVYEGIMASGSRATVWYRQVGERRLVVERIRVLNGPAR